MKNEFMFYIPRIISTVHESLCYTSNVLYRDKEGARSAKWPCDTIIV